ncbi:transglycosylase family protein [Streptomyces sp. NBC_00249]|uniref:transglycosylase family protein n=1 Tax=Streptomyces sp. NBC_00249 TaxID=2975690 RepID=UPI002B1DFC9E|nr:transglycosylase family protein [Streptomyces sp. NBC_00249]
MSSAVRKHSALAVSATALLALVVPLVASFPASAASVATWDKVAACESTNNWKAIDPTGSYFGGLQFSQQTWSGFGGLAYASRADRATKEQQIRIAEKVLAVQGERAWPNCGPAAHLGADHADPYPEGPSYPNPASLGSGTLVKSPNGASVKVLIEGAGIAVAASDVTPDHYDLGKIVLIEDAAFRALPDTPPAGTVIHDEAGGNSRYVVIDGAALKIGAADWTSGGYNIRRDLGVPTSWLQSAAQRTVGNGRVVMNQNEQDPARYVMVNGTALHISAAEWTANGYNQRALMGVPGEWLANAVARQLPNGSIVKDASGTDASVFVMAGGKAVSLTYADFTALGYDKRPLDPVPGTWLTEAKTKPAPADHTMLLSQDSNTVWEVLAGKKRAMTADEFGAGKRSFDDVVSVPTAFTTALPTTP